MTLKLTSLRSRLPVATVGAVLVLVATVVLGPVPATAGPVKCAEGDVTPDDRVFPEPRNSVTFLRFDEFQCGIALLDSQYPDLVEITEVGTSVGGRPLYDILMTDETVAGPKEKLLVVSSIHGNEVGGREGAARVIEDMLDPRFLAGEPWVTEVLDRYVIHFLFPNPDGWVAGDLVGTPGAGGLATRGNDNGRDLNRQFPVKGYISTNNQTFTQPEALDITGNLFDDQDGWYLGTDNHGQGPDTYAAAGLQIVGQFDYQKSETLARFADGITETMATYDVLSQLATLNEVSGADLGPYHWGTLYDMLGYSASGSLIDYYNTVQGLDGSGFATELTIGSEVNIALHGQLLNQVYVDSIRAINYTMFRQAVDRQEFTYTVGGDAAYVFDPEVIAHDDANGAGYEPDTEAGETTDVEPYSVTRMRFFEDLNKYADRPLTSLRVADIADGSARLARFDSLILANDAMPEPGDAAAYFAEISDWVDAGGNLIVTDAAAGALAELGIVAPDDITVTDQYVGSVDEFTDREHPLNANLRGVASQTYDTVPIGYAFGDPDSAPNWTLDQAAWEDAGGFTAGTNGDGQTVYGEVPVGEGRVRFLGALLPDPTEEFYHPYGLQNYAVTYTGYTLLANMLVWENRAQVTDPEPPVEEPTPPVEEPEPPADEVVRVGGGSRLDTAVALSQEAFDSADTVVLARLDDFPDALAASGLAAEADAPVLLTPTGGVDPAVAEELERLGVQEAYLMGGTAALSPQVEADLDALGISHKRIGGPERFATAALIAQEIAALGGPVDQAIVALGARPDGRDAWPDALAAGNLAAAGRAPILLTDPDALPEPTAAALDGLLAEGATVFVAGGTDAVAAGPEAELHDAGYDTQRLAGADRYATAAAIAAEAVAQGAGVQPTVLASGEIFPDAMVAGPAAHRLGGVMLLTESDRLPEDTGEFLSADADDIDTVIVAGGADTISDRVADAARGRIADS